jgi:methyltransferase-like protein/predicted O-methyltransferase YrrM
MNKMAALARNQEIAAYYDALPYQSFCFPQSAPEHLEAIALLFGLNPPSSAKARVLELGCAGGGNLLPFAERNPQARAVGVDISAVHIAQANARLGKMQIRNVRFEQKDLSQLGASLGTFDYIICHGVYSWVPEDVQHAILDIAGKCLAEDGIAYISYNTYPGWKTREIIRDAMRFRGGNRQPEDRLRFARGMIEFMHKVAKPHSTLKATLDEIKPLIDQAAPYYLLHDYLEPCNSPVYFTDFTAAAQRNSLAYLADTSLPTMFASNFGAAIAEPLLREVSGSQIMLEQYLDFITNRPFRQTLLVPRQKAAGIKYRLDAGRLANFHYAGFFEPETGRRQPGDRPGRAYFRSLTGSLHITGTAGNTLAKLFNNAWPSTLDFAQLLDALAKQTKSAPDQCRKTVSAFVEEGIIKGYLRFRRSPLKCATTIPAKPRVSDALRNVLLKTTVSEPISVWNGWHEAVTLSPFEVIIARRLDGRTAIPETAGDIEALAANPAKACDDERQAIELFLQSSGNLTTAIRQTREKLLRSGLITAHR